MASRSNRGHSAARTPAAPVLYHMRTVRVEYHVRSSMDGRYRVDRYIVSYLGPGAQEYRKAFETAPGVPPQIPERGTHAELNRLQYQWPS